jgi:tRNA nucleotidyltransferase (CCA-adding enzyme)
MATTVLQAFKEFMVNYEPTPWQKEQISKHQNYIRDVLSNKVEIKDDFLTGSYVKETQIKPPTDVDLFIVLDLSYYYENEKNPSKLLNWFHRLLKETYSNSYLKTNGQAVTIMFSDGFKMDVVPAFQVNKESYLIPNVNVGKFIKTNPKAYNSLLSEVNQKLNGKLKPIIKMTKCWNANLRNNLNSLHIEILVINSFYDSLIGILNYFQNYQEGLKILFEKLHKLILNSSYEPITGDKVDEYLNNKDKVRIFMSVLINLQYDSIVKAIEDEKNGLEEKAIKTWGEIFGDYFPSYD